MKQQLLCTVLPLLLLSVGESHVADIHLNTIEERHALEERAKEKESEKAESILQDENSSEEELLKAIETLHKNGKLV